MCCLREVDDPRKPSNGTLHDFVEILVIAMAAVLSDCDTVEDIAYWAYKKEDWLRQFLPLKNGVPSEKTFLRIFRALDPKQFEVAFRRWVAGVVGTLNGGIAVDGQRAVGEGHSDHPAVGPCQGLAQWDQPLGARPDAVKQQHQLTCLGRRLVNDEIVGRVHLPPLTFRLPARALAPRQTGTRPSTTRRVSCRR